MSKVQLSQEGAFDEVDVAMTVHPNPVNLSSGKTTALAVNIEVAPTHIAGLPAAVNIGCHVTRHAEMTL